MEPQTENEIHLADQINTLADALLKTGYLPNENESACEMAARLVQMLPPGPAAAENAAAAERVRRVLDSTG